MTCYDNFLALHEQRLFERDEVALEILRSDCSSEISANHSIQTCTVSDSRSLNDQLNRQRGCGEQIFFIVSQRYSWARLQVTKIVFQSILKHFNVSTSFLNVLREFGAKTRHEFPRSSITSIFHRMCSCSSGISTDIDCPHSHELSYVVQYVEKNSRGRGDPWSIRQTGVYCQLDHTTHRTTWIFLQLSKSARVLLEQGITTQDCRRMWKDPLWPHVLVLNATMINWGEYIQNLSDLLQKFDERPRCSIIIDPTPLEHLLDCKTMRSLERLHHKVLIASSSLDSTAELINRLMEYWYMLHESDAFVVEDHTRRSLGCHAADLRLYKKSMHTLLEMVQVTRDWFSKVVESRNLQQLRRSIETSEQYLSSLSTLTLQLRDYASSSGILVSRAHHDARSMKALTTVATALLPASLVAV
ncbi:hypothetical protein NX059_009647 [Plenodomus lindquistii]|nr:hypothetical protein NX059_009647 [Plenodomus lindquistii]